MASPIASIQAYMYDGSSYFTILQADKGRIAKWMRDSWKQVQDDLFAETPLDIDFYNLAIETNQEIGYEYFPIWLQNKINDDHDEAVKNAMIAFKGTEPDNLVYVVYNGSKVISFDNENDFDTAVDLAYNEAAISALSHYGESTTTAQGSYDTKLTTWGNAQ